MNQLKKWLSGVLCAVVLLGMVSEYPAYALKPFDAGQDTTEVEPARTQPGNLIVERYSLAELDEHPEVIEYFKDVGIYDDITAEYSQMLEHPDEAILENVNESLWEADPDATPMTMDELKDIQTRYDLEDSAYEALATEAEDMEVILYHYEATGSQTTRDLPFSGGTVTVALTNSGIHYYLTNVGDPIDHISGEVWGYRLNGSNWYNAPILHDTFESFLVDDGTLYYKQIKAEYVKEKFEDRIVLTQNGVSQVKSNIGEDDRIRYCFAVGPYKDIFANGGERHHFVSQTALKAYGFDTRAACCIRMVQADHKKLSNTGNKVSYHNKEKEHLKNKTYSDLLQMETDDFKAQPDPDGKYRNLKVKYSDEITVCIKQYEDMFGV